MLSPEGARTAPVTDSPFAYCPQLQQMLETQTAVGQSGKRFDDLACLSTANNLRTLRSLAMELRPARTMEIGLGFGGSGLVFTATHRELGALPAGQHTAIDPYQRAHWDGVALRLIEDAKLSGYLDFHESLSSSCLPKLVDAGEGYDMIYVDGSHIFEDVFVDYYFVIRLLNQNGLVLFDDSTVPHIRKVLRFIETNMAESLRPVDLAAYRPAGEKAVLYRLKKFLGRTQVTAFQKIGPAERSWDAPFTSF